MRRVHPCAATVAALFSGVAAGQQPAQDTALPEVNVRGSAVSDDFNPGVSNVGRVPTPIRDVPQTVNVINRAVMESQGATSLSDALRSVPGITLGAAEGGTIGNNINLRGFSARTDVYLDNMRDRGQYYRDVFSLEQVEVLKGPSSMLYGRGSTGGVINQVSREASLKPHSEASVTVGTQPSLRVTADLNRPLGEDSAFRISLLAQDVHSTRDVMENKDLGVAPTLRLGIGSPTEITLGALILHNHDMPDYGLPPVNGRPAPVDRNSFYGLTDDRTVQDVGQFTAKLTHKLTADTRLQNQTRFANYRVDARESGPNNVGTVAGGVYTPFPAANAGNTTAVAPGNLFVGLGSHDRKISDRSLYNQTDLITRFRAGGVTHDVIFGLEVGAERNNIDNTSRNVAPNNFFAVVPLQDPTRMSGAGLASTQGNVVDGRATVVAPYVNDTMTLSKRWKLIAGVRHDRYSAHLTNSVNAPAQADQTVRFNSVRTGLLYQPSDAQSYYVSYGTSFNPSLEALTVTNGTQALQPEKSRAYEAGAKWDLLNGDLALNTALFEIDKTNTRTQIAPGVFDLSGDVRVRGLEVGAAGRPTRRWQVYGGYTYLDAEIVSAADGTQGNVPANTPRHAASLWTTYNLTRDWEVGTGLTWLSSRFTSNNNAVSVPDYARWDATLALHRPKYDIRFNLLNITNRLSFEQLIPSDKGRSVPGIDRTLLVTLVQRF